MKYLFYIILFFISVGPAFGQGAGIKHLDTIPVDTPATQYWHSQIAKDVSTGKFYQYRDGIWADMGYLRVVDSVEQILSEKYVLGEQILNKNMGAVYTVQEDSVGGYGVDSMAVVPVNSGYAVLQPTSDGYINPDWFGAVGDGVNDDVVSVNRALEYATVRGYNFEFSKGKTYKIREYEDGAYGLRISSRNNGMILEGNNARILMDSVDGTTYLISVAIMSADKGSIKNITLKNLKLEGNSTSGLDNAVGAISIQKQTSAGERLAFIDDIKIDNVSISRFNTGITGTPRSINISNIYADSCEHHIIALSKKGFELPDSTENMDSLSDIAGPYRFNINNVIIKNQMPGPGAEGSAIDLTGEQIDTFAFFDRDNSEANINNIHIENWHSAFKIQGYNTANLTNWYVSETKSSAAVFQMNDDFNTINIDNIYIRDVEGGIVNSPHTGKNISITNLYAHNFNKIGTATPAFRVAGSQSAYVANVFLEQDTMVTYFDDALLNFTAPKNGNYVMDGFHVKNYGPTRLFIGGAGKVSVSNSTFHNCFSRANSTATFYLSGYPTGSINFSSVDIIMEDTVQWATSDNVFLVYEPLDTLGSVTFEDMYIHSEGVHFDDNTGGKTRMRILNSRQMDGIYDSGSLSHGDIVGIGDKYIWYSDSLSGWRWSSEWPLSHNAGHVLSEGLNLYNTDGSIPDGIERSVSVGNGSTLTFQADQSTLEVKEDTIRVNTDFFIDNNAGLTPGLFFTNPSNTWQLYQSGGSMYLDHGPNNGEVFIRALDNSNFVRIRPQFRIFSLENAGGVEFVDFDDGGIWFRDFGAGARIGDPMYLAGWESDGEFVDVSFSQLSDSLSQFQTEHIADSVYFDTDRYYHRAIDGSVTDFDIFLAGGDSVVYLEVGGVRVDSVFLTPTGGGGGGVSDNIYTADGSTPGAVTRTVTVGDTLRFENGSGIGLDINSNGINIDPAITIDQWTIETSGNDLTFENTGNFSLLSDGGTLKFRFNTGSNSIFWSGIGNGSEDLASPTRFIVGDINSTVGSYSFSAAAQKIYENDSALEQHANTSTTTDGSGDVVVTFGTAFATAPSVILVTSRITGHHYAVTSRTTTGFTVRVADGADAALVSTAVDFDWVAKL